MFLIFKIAFSITYQLARKATAFMPGGGCQRSWYSDAGAFVQTKEELDQRDNVCWMALPTCHLADEMRNMLKNNKKRLYKRKRRENKELGVY